MIGPGPGGGNRPARRRRAPRSISPSAHRHPRLGRRRPLDPAGLHWRNATAKSPALASLGRSCNDQRTPPPPPLLRDLFRPVERIERTVLGITKARKPGSRHSIFSVQGRYIPGTHIDFSIWHLLFCINSTRRKIRASHFSAHDVISHQLVLTCEMGLCQVQNFYFTRRCLTHSVLRNCKEIFD